MSIPWFDGIDQFRNAKFATVGRHEKKARRMPGFRWNFASMESTCDLYQVPGAFHRVAAIGPLDVGFITDDCFHHAIGALQYAEATNQVHLGAQGEARSAGIEQPAEC
jgi:hypothetical protein